MLASLILIIVHSINCGKKENVCFNSKGENMVFGLLMYKH